MRVSMPKLLGSLTLCVASLVTGFGSSWAVRETPSRLNGIWIENHGTELGVQGDEFSEAILLNHYAVTIDPSGQYSATPSLTIQGFESYLSTGYGFWCYVGHGSDSVGTPLTFGLSIENYCGTAACKTARDNELNFLLAHGYPATQIGPTRYVENGVVLSYGIAVTPAFISPRFQNHNSMVHLSASFGFQASAGFSTARTRLGPDHSPLATDADAAVETLYNRMKGFDGAEHRPVGAARDGLSIWSAAGSDSMVFAPIVRSFTLSNQSADGRKADWEFIFDCPMDTSLPAGNAVAGEDYLTITSPFWVGNTRLKLTTTRHVGDSGKVRLLADRSGGSPGLRSGVGASLDGNSNGIYSQTANGMSPNEDDFVLDVGAPYSDDNPAADLSYTLPTVEPDGVHIRWVTSEELDVESFLVEKAASRFGPFSVLSTVLPTGGGAYEVIDAGTTEGFYRLREIDTYGDTLFYFADTVVTPRPPIPLEVEWGIDADSLHQLQLEAFPGEAPQGGWPNPPIEYAIVLPNLQNWISRATPLANLWASRGISTGLLPIDLPATSASVKTAIQNEFTYGNGALRYVLLVGDANDHLYPGEYGSPTQPEYNLIPHSEYAWKDTLQDQWFSKHSDYIPSDWGYVDFNADGLPDIAIGRVPARTYQEVTYFVEKTLLAAERLIYDYDPNTMRRTGLWSYTFSDQSLSGELVEQLKEQIIAELPAPLMPVELVWSPENALPYYDVEDGAIRALNDGLGIVITMGTYSSCYSLNKFLNQVHGFEWSDSRLTDDGIPPFFLTPSCDLGNIDQSEEPDFDPHQGTGRPLLERGLLHPSRGSWGVLAPTRGSRQYANGLLIRECLKLAYEFGAPSAGWAAILAVANLMQSSPQYLEYLRSFVFLGDPALPLPGQTVVVGVGDAKRPIETPYLRLHGRNPTGSALSLAYGLPKAGAVHLQLFDVRGRLRGEVREGQKEAGEHMVNWNLADTRSGPLGPGVYFARLTIDGAPQGITKFVLLH